MQRILALDFDGVISDSAPECYWTGLRTYLRMRPASRLASAAERAVLDNVPPDRRLIEASELYRGFVDLMPLGNRAEDFGVVLSILESGQRVPNQSAYDAIRSAIGEEFLAEFHESFYELRREAASRDPAAWERLVGPYEAFVELLLDRPPSVQLAVATAKDRASVTRLLSLYGLADEIPADLLLDKDLGVSKRNHMVELARRTRAEFGSITFLDDKVNHLDAVAPLGVRCCLATWGYNGDREHNLARERGYPLCDLDGARTLLFDQS